MATYAQTMDVIGGVYSADQDAIDGPLRGRVQNLQKMGIPIAQQVGRGKKISYGRAELYQLVLCLELAEIGLTPSLSAALVTGYWKAVWPEIQTHVEVGGRGAEDQVAWVRVNQMSSAWVARSNALVPAPISAIDQLTRRSADQLGGRRHFCVLKLFEIVADVEEQIDRLGLKESF